MWRVAGSRPRRRTSGSRGERATTRATSTRASRRLTSPIPRTSRSSRTRRSTTSSWATRATWRRCPTSSVALVVTSPPYFAGKEYEEALGEGHVPGTYLDYLEMLDDVFAECARTLEPGGRIAVNVANLGRKPYRSLSADVIDILQNRLRLLLRGEILWQKARGRRGQLRVGLVPAAGEPGRARPDRAGRRRQQGTVRPRDRARETRAALGPALGGVDVARRVHGGDDRRVGVPARARDPGRAPGAVPGRAARCA